MPAVAFAAPILPGKVADWTAMVRSWEGEERSGYLESRNRAGVTREVCWLQRTPQGEMAIIYLEADDLEAAFRTFGTSDSPFDQQFRSRVLEIHGLDLSGPLPGGLPELAFDSPLP